MAIFCLNRNKPSKKSLEKPVSSQNPEIKLLKSIYTEENNSELGYENYFSVFERCHDVYKKIKENDFELEHFIILTVRK